MQIATDSMNTLIDVDDDCNSESQTPICCDARPMYFGSVPIIKGRHISRIIGFAYAHWCPSCFRERLCDDKLLIDAELRNASEKGKVYYATLLNHREAAVVDGANRE